jgi:hypothetical protein
MFSILCHDVACQKEQWFAEQDKGNRMNSNSSNTSALCNDQKILIEQICLDPCDGPVDSFVVLCRGLEAGAKRGIGIDAIAYGIELALDWLGVSVTKAGIDLIKGSAANVTKDNVDPEKEANILFDALQSAGVKVDDPAACYEPYEPFWS